MSDSLETKKAKRFKFLHALYEKTDGNVHVDPNMSEIGAAIGLSDEDTELVVQYLQGENLIEFSSMGGYITITHHGVVEVERALSAPQRPTHYFPPVVNILQIGSVSGSNIQQAGDRAVFEGHASAVEPAQLLAVVAELRSAMVELSRNTSRSAELEAMVMTLEAQLKAPSANRVIVAESLKTVRSILEGIVGNVLAADILARLASLGVG